jgi:hypothetical protein
VDGVPFLFPGSGELPFFLRREVLEKDLLRRSLFVRGDPVLVEVLEVPLELVEEDIRQLVLLLAQRDALE